MNEPPHKGGIIRTARMEKGLSQAALAAELGVRRQTVIQWEAGESLPSFSNALALCKVLGLEVSAIAPEEAA